MASRVDMAHERHDRGYNCAQAVACAFADVAGLSEADVFRACEGLGLGMGGMDATCGALSGAIVVAGLMNSSAHLDAPDSKANTYALASAMTKRFLESCGSLVCRELRGGDTGTPLTSCHDCITRGAMIVEEMLPEIA